MARDSPLLCLPHPLHRFFSIQVNSTNKAGTTLAMTTPSILSNMAVNLTRGTRSGWVLSPSIRVKTDPSDAGYIPRPMGLDNTLRPRPRPRDGTKYVGGLSTGRTSSSGFVDLSSHPSPVRAVGYQCGRTLLKRISWSAFFGFDVSLVFSDIL